MKIARWGKNKILYSEVFVGGYIREDYTGGYGLCNDKSMSICKEHFGKRLLDSNNEPLNGELYTSDRKNIIRVVNGYIDGNVYDFRGEVLYTYPAIESEQGYEYWTKGFPQGFPAICHHSKKYEEYWSGGDLIKIIKYVEDEDYEDEFPWHAEEVDYPLIGEYDNIIDSIINFKKDHGIEVNGSFLIGENLNKENDELQDEKVDKILSLDNISSFQDRLLEIMKVKGFTDKNVYKPIFMSEKAFNKVKNSKPYESVSYEMAIMIAFGLHLTFEQMVKFVNFAGKGFRNFGVRDQIIREFFKKRNYMIFELNTKLVKERQAPFLSIKDEKIEEEKKSINK